MTSVRPFDGDAEDSNEGESLGEYEWLLASDLTAETTARRKANLLHNHSTKLTALRSASLRACARLLGLAVCVRGDAIGLFDLLRWFDSDAEGLRLRGNDDEVDMMGWAGRNVGWLDGWLYD